MATHPGGTLSLRAPREVKQRTVGREHGRTFGACGGSCLFHGLHLRSRDSATDNISPSSDEADSTNLRLPQSLLLGHRLADDVRRPAVECASLFLRQCEPISRAAKVRIGWCIERQLAKGTRASTRSLTASTISTSF
jgi:hypothetical protein